MRIVPFDQRHLSAYTSLVNLARADRPRQRQFTADQIESMYLKNPKYDRAGHFLAFLGNHMVGEVVSLLEPQQDTKDKCSSIHFELSVLPKYRRKGVAKALLAETCAHAKKRNIKSLRTVVPVSCKGSAEFYDQLGFIVYGRDCELAYDLRRGVPRVEPPRGYLIRTADFPQEKLQFLRVWNSAFADSTSLEMSTDAFEQFLDFPGVEAGYLVAARKSDDTIVGVLTCYIDQAYNSQNRLHEGTIEIVGVLREERSQRLGAALVSRSLEWMNSRGVTTVLARTSSDNVSSMSLSRRLGCCVVEEFLLYELQL